MSYIPQGKFSPEQTRALYATTPSEIRELDAQDRLSLAIQHQEAEAHRREVFWTAMTAALPIAAFLGITWTRK